MIVRLPFFFASTLSQQLYLFWLQVLESKGNDSEKAVQIGPRKSRGYYLFKIWFIHFIFNNILKKIRVIIWLTLGFSALSYYSLRLSVINYFQVFLNEEDINLVISYKFYTRANVIIIEVIRIF